MFVCGPRVDRSARRRACRRAMPEASKRREAGSLRGTRTAQIVVARTSPEAQSDRGISPARCFLARRGCLPRPNILKGEMGLSFTLRL